MPPLARYSPLLLTLLVLAAACGDSDEGVPRDSSSSRTRPTATRFTERTERYMQLAEARDFLRDLGIEGTSLSAEHYECIQSTCPDERPGDDSWGCLSLLPTGNPDNVESLLPDDPPNWYSAIWHGAFGEAYTARPEPVVGEPTMELEPTRDLACGAPLERSMTAAEAVAFLADVGLEGVWQSQDSAGTEPACPRDRRCPIAGIPADTVGCLSINLYELPRHEPRPEEPSVDVYVGWFSEGNVESPDGLYLNYSLRRSLNDAETAVEPRTDDECLALRGGRPSDPYESVPYTELMKPSYWQLLEAPTGTTLQLDVAVGNSCDSFERVDVEETEDAVTIRSYSRQTLDGGGCDDLMLHEQLSVELEEPLGDRDLLGCAPEEIWYIDHDVDCAEPRPF